MKVGATSDKNGRAYSWDKIARIKKQKESSTRQPQASEREPQDQDILTIYVICISTYSEF